jgi:hypothetical protein
MEQNLGAWTIEEQAVLLAAIEKYGNVQRIVTVMLSETNRSEKSILRRLNKIGFKAQAVGKYTRSSNLGI